MINEENDVVSGIKIKGIEYLGYVPIPKKLLDQVFFLEIQRKDLEKRQADNLKSIINILKK